MLKNFAALWISGFVIYGGYQEVICYTTFIASTLALARPRFNTYSWSNWIHVRAAAGPRHGDVQCQSPSKGNGALYHRAISTITMKAMSTSGSTFSQSPRFVWREPRWYTARLWSCFSVPYRRMSSHCVAG